MEIDDHQGASAASRDDAAVSQRRTFMSWMPWLVGAILLVAAAWVALAAVGASRWSRATQALHQQLDAARSAPAVNRYDARELEGLPAPVQRYFRAVLKDGQQVVTAVSVRHSGSFNMGQGGDNWKPFTSTQKVVTRRPGFVWDGRVAMLPGLPVRVHDAYVAGLGILHPAILGLFDLTDMRGTGEMARGELMRFFAEAAWYPTALLPSQGIRWEALDDRSAKATLTEGDLVLTMTFGFGADGLIESIRAEARGMTVGNTIVMQPWEGRMSNYQLRDAMRVPLTGEVAWLLPEAEGGRKSYWRGEIVGIAYEFAK
jgi:hypothetical protein